MFNYSICDACQHYILKISDGKRKFHPILRIDLILDCAFIEIQSVASSRNNDEIVIFFFYYR